MKEEFNEKAYLEAHPDVAASVEAGQFTSGLEHYEMYGRSEKRKINQKSAQTPTPVDEPSPTGEFLNPFLRFEQRRPSAQTATDVFKDRWASNLMPLLGVTGTGKVHLFENDARPQQAATALGQDGRIAGMTVLELGPLEGGHSYQLESLGAASITAVEANVEAYLKCLVVKEALALQNSRFLLGDIIEYLSSEPGRFDLVFCSGVLYHMADPLALIRAIANVTDRCFVWTHYYDPDNHPLEYHGQTHSLDGFETTYWSHIYGDRSRGFWGGNKASAAWLQREALLDAFRHFGFSEITVILEDKTFVNGPNITFAARRPTRNR
jgi:SAM-dependent methyltransferase